MSNRILVVDDDADFVELLSFNLQKAGFIVGTAADGVEAIKKVRSLNPDLIVLDLMLPELDGLAVCEVLRREPVTRSIPVIMVTAVSGGLGRLAGLDAGANEYITKPFSLKQLVGRIQQMLEGISLPPSISGSANGFPA
jgi:DNA-binding response OmpR family regulator